MPTKKKYNNPLQATLSGIADMYRPKKNLVALPDELGIKGKTIMITGGSSGLGYATALRLANAGARIILAIRSGIPEVGEKIISQTGNRDVRMYHVDLSDFESITALIQKLAEDNIRLDVLISNAAIVPLKSKQTKQGLEEMFMVNCLAPFYLITKLIEGNILRKDEGRIVIVSSESHRNPEGFAWDEFGKYHPYGMGETVKRYGYFKLLLTTFAVELNRRLQAKNYQISMGVLCPGPVNSNIAREAPGWLQPILKLVFSLFFKSPAKASDPVVYLATQCGKQDAQLNRDEPSGELNPSMPEYLFLMQHRDIDAKATGVEAGKTLWNKSASLIQSLGYDRPAL